MRARLSTPTTPPILHPLFQRGHLHIKSENLPSVAKISLTIVSKNKNALFAKYVAPHWSSNCISFLRPKGAIFSKVFAVGRQATKACRWWCDWRAGEHPARVLSRTASATPASALPQSRVANRFSFKNIMRVSCQLRGAQRVVCIKKSRNRGYGIRDMLNLN